ncbi:MAG: sugar ABC transporter ATP-binding protein [Desulfobacterales bacterium]|nr:sugar ABC transporter ATP-binding protein [Desulfobacterales bacterium]
MIKIKNINKKFRDIEVLKSINIEVKEGEIHGIVGANGSGKTTLLNILFGHPNILKTGGYSGEIFINNLKSKISRPNDAIRLGIGMIHQEFAIIPEMTVAENIKIYRENTFKLTDKIFGKNLSYIDKSQNYIDTKSILKTFNIDLDPSLKVFNLSLNMKQFIEIAREIDRKDLKILLLDEPTAILNKEDTVSLISILKKLSKKGISIIYVSHKLDEVIALCERITVMRDGEIIKTYERQEFDSDNISENMMGYKVNKVINAQNREFKNILLKFNDFSVDIPGETVKNFNLDVYKGEIIGISGSYGRGNTALSWGIMGLHKTKGEIILNNKKLSNRNVSNILLNGIYMVPEDRRGAGLLLNHSVMENIIFTSLQMKNNFLMPYPFKLFSFINKQKSLDYSKKIIDQLNIKCSSALQKVNELSGGNQQKVCLARAITFDPEILFISEPTRGIDLGAKELILDMLISINKKKTTIIISSSEIDELKRICDRIIEV